MSYPYHALSLQCWCILKLLRLACYVVAVRAIIICKIITLHMCLFFRLLSFNFLIHSSRRKRDLKLFLVLLVELLHVTYQCSRCSARGGTFRVHCTILKSLPSLAYHHKLYRIVIISIICKFVSSVSLPLDASS